VVPRRRLWWLALAVSLLVHLGLLGGVSWVLPNWETPEQVQVFEAALIPVGPAVAVKPPPAPLPPVAKPSPVAQPAAPVPLAVASDEAPIPDAPVVFEHGDLEIPVPVREPEPRAAVSEAPPIEPLPPPLNALPTRIDLQFQVSYGLASGKQTLVWVNEGGERYTVISVAEATGLAGLFYQGRFVQTSAGRITATGLQPETFWDQRGDKRTSARFDAETKTVTYTPAKGGPRHFNYPGTVQDVLSLFFQLALTAPPSAAELSYAVFNGKKLRTYHYLVRGEALLETAVGSLRTLHLERTTDDDGRFDIWLAIDRHYLPVRVVRSDEKGNEIELTLQSMKP